LATIPSKKEDFQQKTGFAGLKLNCYSGLVNNSVVKSSPYTLYALEFVDCVSSGLSSGVSTLLPFAQPSLLRNHTPVS
jgi:hypothetical protein